MALVPYGPPGLGLFKDTVTGNIGTPGGGFGGTGGLTSSNIPNAAIQTAPRPEVTADAVPTTTVTAKADMPNIPPPEAPPPVTDPGQPFEEKPPSPVEGREPKLTPQPKRIARPDQEGSELWLRRWKLSIGPQEQSSSALDLSDFAFEFEVEQAQWLKPYASVIKIYNVPDKILSKLQKELTHIVLEAGYIGSQYGKVFGGPIAYYSHGRVNSMDTIVEIHAVQNEQIYNGGIINTFMPAGYTKKDVVNACIEVLAPYGITAGQMTDMGDEKSPRGRVLHGQAVDVLRDTAHSLDAQIFIDKSGNLHVLGQAEALEMAEQTVPILNANSGLVDVPFSTMGGGVEARMLLNPKVEPGGQIRIDMKIKAYERGPAAGQVPDSNWQIEQSQEGLRPDGYYTVISVKHWGENRGNPWYTDVKTFSLNKTEVGIRTTA